MKSDFTETIRFRVPKSIKLRFDRLAKRRTKNPSELGREAVLWFMEQEEATAKTKAT